MSRYYIADGMVQRGPFEMADLPGQGLRPDTLVWKEGMEQWRRADQVEELIFAGQVTVAPPAMAPAPPPPQAGPGGGYVPYANPHPPYPPFNAAASNKVAAGICGILLGGFGVHKFILGMHGAGAAMLLITVLGWFLTCGMASMVIGIIGLIEGIIYLTRTDEQFYYQYVVQKKQWF